MVSTKFSSSTTSMVPVPRSSLPLITVADECLFRRQINPRRRALAELAGNRHAAAVVGDDAIDQRQAQARDAADVWW